jgi:hypothetical protein
MAVSQRLEVGLKAHGRMMNGSPGRGCADSPQAATRAPRRRY